jgi:hypothetical protein
MQTTFSTFAWMGSLLIAALLVTGAAAPLVTLAAGIVA